MVLIGCISRSLGPKKILKCNFQKSSCLKLQVPGLSYLVYNSIIQRSSTKVVQIMPLGLKLTPSGVTTLNWIIKLNLQTDFFLEPLMGIWPNSTGMVPGWSPTKIVEIVLIGCISRFLGQKIGLQIAIFKNLVWNSKAQSFHIWYIASSRGPLHIFGGQH